jgi:hypothetical protein
MRRIPVAMPGSDERFVGDLRRYRITATIAEISVDTGLKGMTASGVPSPGISIWRKGPKKLFENLVSVIDRGRKP